MSKTQEKLTVEYKPLKKNFDYSISNVLNNRDLKQMEIRVLKLQKRIYQASERGDIKVCRKLQKTMMSSWSAKCLSIYKITQKNDTNCELPKLHHLDSKETVELLNNITITKPTKTSSKTVILNVQNLNSLKTNLIQKKVCANLLEMTFEPEWDGKLAPNNNNNFFVPKVLSEQKLNLIRNTLDKKPKYVLSADLGFLDNSLMNPICLKKLEIYPKLRRQLKFWLKSEKNPNKDLLGSDHLAQPFSSIFLKMSISEIKKKLQNYVTIFLKTDIYQKKTLKFLQDKYEFVIFADTLDIIIDCRTLIEKCLISLGFSLKSNELIISHTLNKIDGNFGFYFLGFYIRQYKLSNLNSSKNNNLEASSFITEISLSNFEIKKHLDEIAKVIRAHKSSSQMSLINQLNPIILKWLKNYSWVNNQKLFSKIDYLIWQKLRSWAKRKGKGTINKEKYWRQVDNKSWCFRTESDIKLMTHKKCSEFNK
jgi:RNA-directed DNA polymerase